MKIGEDQFAIVRPDGTVTRDGLDCPRIYDDEHYATAAFAGMSSSLRVVRVRLVDERVIEAMEKMAGDFKNFHRLLCERFNYEHDERDWKRDQLSLIEHIAALAADRSAGGEGKASAEASR